MARADAIGLFWQDQPTNVRGERVLGPIPPIPATGWTVPTEMPNIQHAKWISLDVETYDPELNDYGPGWARGKGHICGISLAVEGAKWYFPIRHEVERELNLDADMVLRWANWALSGNGRKIGANVMYDIGWLRHEGVIVKGKIYDCQYAEALIEETAKLNLEGLGWRYLKEGKKSEVLKVWAQNYYGGSEAKWRRNIYRCPVTLVGPYAEQDATMPFDILMKQWPIMERRGLLDLFEMECGLINLLVDMRFKGITVDIPYAERLYDEFTLEADKATKEAEYIAGASINANSAENLAGVFDKLGLAYGRTTPSESNPEGNPSFTKDFLKTVKHPFAEKILRVREMDKLRGTFVKSYLLDANVNGKLYCLFHPVSSLEGGTRTGRFSSSDPNLQNIPTRTEEGGKIRQAFIMDEGHKQVRDYDYSQIEYRFLAHFATGEGADAVRAKYHADPKLDYHDLIGSMITAMTGIVLKRGYVKNINFGLVYGLGIEALAENLGVPVSEAKRLSAAFHEAIPFARATMDDITRTINHSGIITTILGRQSHFDLWEPSSYGMRGGYPLPYGAAVAKWGSAITRAYAYRGTNYRLQGSAAEIMKKGMLTAYESGVFDVTGVPRLTVHDELWFSDPGDVPDDAWDEMKHIFENCIPEVRVPIRFDCGIGPTWKEAH